MNLLLVFVLLISSVDEERQAKILIDGIRQFGGKYNSCPVYVFLGDTLKTKGNLLDERDIFLFPLEKDESLPPFLFSYKIQAMAQAEKLVTGKTGTLVWLDPVSLIINQPDELELKPVKEAAIRPVFLKNNVGLSPDSPVDKFWAPILDYTGLKIDNIPVVETFVDNQKIRSYFNCGIFSIRPELGILQECKKLFSILLKNEKYISEACNDNPHRIFLHQAVFSALIMARIKPEGIQWFSNSHVYPLGLHSRIKEEKRVKKLSDLNCFIYENLWGTPEWITNIVPVEESLKKWLKKEYEIIYKVTDNIYREEGLCNTYLIKTTKGYVMIDPGGASDSANSILYSLNIKPEAILITHAHTDHTQGIGLWKKNRDIPVIAQREFVDFIKYNYELNKFYEIKNSIQGNVIPVSEYKIEPNVLFGDKYTFRLGNIDFIMIHTSGETPDHNIIWVPKLKAAFIGDNYNSAFSNISPIRGSKPRWADEYINSLDTIMALKPEMIFPGHGEPIIGKENVLRNLRRNRDAIKYVYDKTIKGMNEGKSIYELMNEIQLPEEYKELKQSYGKVSWAIRGIYQGYAGWFDGNPVNMYSLPQSSIYGELVSMAGVDNMVKKADSLFKNKDAIKALHLLDIVLNVYPKYKSALELRLSIMQYLYRESDNYIESKFLRYFIKLMNN